MLTLLILGMLIVVGAAKEGAKDVRGHDSGGHFFEGSRHDNDFRGHNYDWLGTGFTYHYPTYYTYPSYYSWYYPTYYTYPSYYNSYYNYYPYYENGVEMRPGEATAEWLFYHGIGEQWVGGNPPHSRW
jgi:hypothetical protein